MKFKAISMIEVLTILAIMTILMNISYSSYSKLKIEYRRKEAHSELIKLKNDIEKQALTSSSTTTAIVGNLASRNTPNNYYNITATVNAANNSYTLTATAQGPQAQDTLCSTISLTVSSTDPEGTRTGCWD